MSPPHNLDYYITIQLIYCTLIVTVWNNPSGCSIWGNKTCHIMTIQTRYACFSIYLTTTIYMTRQINPNCLIMHIITAAYINNWTINQVYPVSYHHCLYYQLNHSIGFPNTVLFILAIETIDIVFSCTLSSLAKLMLPIETIKIGFHETISPQFILTVGTFNIDWSDTILPPFISSVETIAFVPPPRFLSVSQSITIDYTCTLSPPCILLSCPGSTPFTLSVETINCAYTCNITTPTYQQLKHQQFPPYHITLLYYQWKRHTLWFHIQRRNCLYHQLKHSTACSHVHYYNCYILYQNIPSCIIMYVVTTVHRISQNISLCRFMYIITIVYLSN